MGKCDESSPSQAGRGRRVVVLVAVVLVLCTPVALDRDDFPLSTYPMYATARGETTQFTLANGLDATGERQRLSLGLIADTDDPLIASGELASDVRAGLAADRCRAIAERVATSDRDSVVEVEVVSELHRTVAATLGEDSLVERTEHARCQVPR